MDPSKLPGVIRKLEETVVNRIAAGEVIQRPANALKELMENSLDAGSTSIQVMVRSGGMKALQIQDDGTGIRKEDLPIVCERFTTSKLQKFEDLQQIGTYGFRGEALASISHVAHLAIVTKTRDSPCAYRAEYCDGKLKEFPGRNVQNPKPCAGKQGTWIIVEDLFYNMDTRRRALKSTAEEHNKIVEVVTKYAIHNAKVGFSLKKLGETMAEVLTPPKSTVLDNIKLLYGASISRELLEIKCEDKATGFQLNGYASNANYSTKKLTFLLFINHRLVDSSALRKSIESIYYNYLPKGTHPFVYFSIEIDPRNVDVNVHPTKHEVHFLHEDMITTSITNAVESVLLGSNHSRTFMVQSLLPGTSFSASANPTTESTKKAASTIDKSLSKNTSFQIAPKNMVRTDPKIQKLDKFLSSTLDPDASHIGGFNDTPSRIEPGDISIIENISKTVNSSSNVSNLGLSNRREIRLRSVKILRQKIEEDASENLVTVFKNHTFVGCLDRGMSLMQHDVNLYLCNTTRLSAELFYQKLLINFGNFPRIQIEQPITIKDLAIMAQRTSKENITNGSNKSVEEIATDIQNLLLGKSAMLNDYFSLKIESNGTIKTLPQLIENHIPDMVNLPQYILDIGTKVAWTSEFDCFRTFCHYTSIFYSIHPGNDAEIEETTMNGQSWRWTIEHIIFAEFKKSFLPPKVFGDDSTLVLLTSLPDLYKVFERC